MRVYLFVISLMVFVEALHGQTLLDTLMLHHQVLEVTVADSLPANHTVQHLSNQFRLNRAHEVNLDLGTYIDRTGLAQINITGPTGTSATIRFRGSSGDHTALMWSGFNINSVSLGSADLSFIPLFFFDDVALTPNTDLAGNTTSGFSASIHLGEKGAAPFSTRVLASYNSMSNTTIGLDLPLTIALGNRKTSRSQLLLRTRYFAMDMQNNFRYTDKYQLGNPSVLQRHNDGTQRGIKQEIHWTTGSHQLAGMLWHQTRSMELPAIMGKKMDGTAEQDDVTAKWIITHDYKWRRITTSIGMAYIRDRLDYRDYPTSNGSWLLNSQMQTDAWMNRATVRYQHGSWNGNVSGATQLLTAKSANYSRPEEKERRSQFAGSIARKMGRHNMELDYKADIRMNILAHAWSVNYQWQRTWKQTTGAWGVQVSRVFRFPDMNELYWNQGGNSDLNPEKGYRYTAHGLLSKTYQRVQLQAKPSIYYSEIHGWIQWVPMEGAIWSPINLRQVRARGGELPITLEIEINKWVFHATTQYAYTRAQSVQAPMWDSNIAKEMIYTPNHLAALDIQLSTGRFSLGVSAKYSSSRFTDESNSELRQLDPYTLYHAWLSGKFGKGSQMFELTLSANNLLNTSYESVRSYAMPGRVFQCTLNYKINKTN